MSPDDIAADLGFEITAVKAKLMQISSKFRKDCGKEDTEEDKLNFSDEQLLDFNKVIYNTAMSAESEELRFRAACYGRDDKKGRKDVVKQVGNVMTNNFLQFNEIVQQAKERSKKMMEAIAPKDSDIKV